MYNLVVNGVLVIDGVSKPLKSWSIAMDELSNPGLEGGEYIE